MVDVDRCKLRVNVVGDVDRCKLRVYVVAVDRCKLRVKGRVNVVNRGQV